MVDKKDTKLPVTRQSFLLGLSRSSLYYRPRPASDLNLRLMRVIDEQHLRTPFYGARKMRAFLLIQGFLVSLNRVKRLRRLMGIEAIYQKPNLSRRHPLHKIYPYLLRNLEIVRPNQVWCADITYIPMERGWVYLVAVMDWYSRKVLAWRLSITMESSFCLEALQEAMDRYGRPEIFNTDQGGQFTCAAFIEQLLNKGIQISMDGKGRFLDNIFIERLWRSLKYEDVYLKAYPSVQKARESIGAWINFYNDERPHQTLGYQTPSKIFAGAPACGYVDNARALPHIPTGPTTTRKNDSIEEGGMLQLYSAVSIAVTGTH